MSKIPKYTSTPSRIGPKARRSVHDSVMPETPGSPIENNESKNSSKNRSNESLYNSESDEYNSDTCDVSESRNTSKSSQNIKEKENNNLPRIFVVFSLLLGLFAVLIIIGKISNNEESLNLYSNEDFVRDFKNQNNDLWYHIEGAVDDIEKINRIAVFMFLYTDDNSEKVLDKIINKITKYYHCKIKQCSLDRVNIEGSELAKPFYTEDYGRILTTYKDELEQKSVLVVKNLEKIPAGSAQAFHSICDQYGPLVEKSFIILTMKVDRIPDEAISFCEEKLRKQWITLPDDKFYPLYARLSNVITGIYPEDS